MGIVIWPDWPWPTPPLDPPAPPPPPMPSEPPDETPLSHPDSSVPKKNKKTKNDQIQRLAGVEERRGHPYTRT